MTIASARIAGNPRVPEPVNEQARGYAPGSVEARSVLAAIDAVKAAGVRDLPNVINGVRRPIGDSDPVVAPHEHALQLGRIPVASAEAVNAAIDAALAARHDWSRMDWQDRVAIFLRAAELVNSKYRDELMATTMLGQSKTFHQAEIDVNELVDFFRYNVKLAEQIYTGQPFSVTGVHNVMDHRPLEGFVLALTPFNFTAIAGNLPSTPALMGNVVVWKPSEKSALSSDVVMRIFEEAGVPAGVINLVHGDGKLVTEVAQASEHLAGISFTGSTAVFRDIWRGIATNLDIYRSYPRLVGETGGKNAVIAHPSADPQALLVALVRGAFEYQGQKCSAASRAYIPRSLWRELREPLIETTAGLVVGDVTRHETYVGAVIDDKAADRLGAAFDRVKQSSDHEILVGGSVSTDKGWFVEPTIVETTDPRSFVMSEEFFGPLLSVYIYEDEDWDQTLRLLDTTSQYALTCSVFASDRIAINTALDVLRDNAGMTYINDKPTGATMGQQSFGGSRGSGTNDKTGSVLALQRWVSGRFIKENMTPDLDWTYPYMG
ncbi:L-glutamate gamma-semialdehyde dehydrogenase [Gordonia rhizosphera]|uniref:L-glutamate gamma-semialdehyde dehydrogenase n=1 Tax=Gordonia rhizosphera NBRC 16068 TaxID=1108045 RepID=K6VW95_9ACTN|nr:L-glutamate gamma-semialdehyde dehydrogenase [Gordonia rhizosphera]GAB91180.1 putative delta-1-pyrroline-5-carboxylate dehydrogenase [Gordonia rhizosphera NBRC 16068]